MKRCLLLTLLLMGCGRSALLVQNDYITEHDLASYHVDTPDPELSAPEIGQKLTIYWNMASHRFKKLQEPSLHIRVRFGDGEEVSERRDIKHASGYTQFFLTDNEYWTHHGIRTYQMRLMDGEELLERTQHQLWVERITVGEDL